jgi:hypothetical protein
MLTREELIQRLKQYTVTIEFKKKDGTERVMKCTLREELIQPYEKKTERVKPVNANVLPVWDVEKNSWRSIRLDTIRYPITLDY